MVRESEWGPKQRRSIRGFVRSDEAGGSSACPQMCPLLGWRGAAAAAAGLDIRVVVVGGSEKKEREKERERNSQTCPTDMLLVNPSINQNIFSFSDIDKHCLPGPN